MNYIKLQQDILKSLDKRKTERDFRMIDCERDGRIWISYKGYTLFSIPKEMWFLDKEAIIRWQGQDALGEQIVNNVIDKEREAEVANYRGTALYNQVTANVYKKHNNEEWRGDAKLFKYCTKFNTYKFAEKKGLLYIYDNYVCVGAVLPFTWWLMKEVG